MSILGTLFSIVTGGFGGGLLRLIPEGIKFAQNWLDNKHEMAKLQLQAELQKAGFQQRLAEINAEEFQQQTLAQIQGATVLTGSKSGIWIVDLLNGLVRPVVTFWYFGIYAMFKTLALALWAISSYKVLVLAGFSLDAMLAVLSHGAFPWQDVDMAMLSGIISFWFLGRTISQNR